MFKVGDKVRYTLLDVDQRFQNMIILFIHETEWPYSCIDKYGHPCAFYEWELEAIN